MSYLSYNKYYFIGIGGIGMSAVAEYIHSIGKNVSGYDNTYGYGLGIHEMGTARMGRDPKTSVLNKYNQLHNVPNVFVTDGSAMTSGGCTNPSLTYMALTARAADYAVKELKKMNKIESTKKIYYDLTNKFPARTFEIKPLLPR